MPPFADPERSDVIFTFDVPGVAPVVFAEILAADQPEMGAVIRLLSPAPSPRR
jgi:hypothetical protein